jgi:hypothetical protein
MGKYCPIYVDKSIRNLTAAAFVEMANKTNVDPEYPVQRDNVKTTTQ